MSTRIPLFRVTTGLNTLNDPSELNHDPETGEIELAQAVNVDISNTGQRISRRKGAPRIVDGEFHSGFLAGNEIFCIQEFQTWASLMRFNPSDNTLTGIRSGLSKRRRMAYVHVDGLTYYTNGAENGVIENAVSRPWMMGEYIGHENFRELVDPPLGTVLEVIGGYMLIGDGKIIWVSEEYDHSAFNTANRYLGLEHEVSMIKAVTDGVWVGTKRRTLFLAGTEPEKWHVAREIFYGVMTGAVIQKPISAFELVFEGLTGEGFLWLSRYGICWGGPGGQFINLTEHVLDPGPLVGDFGAGFEFGGRAVFSIET